MASPDPARLLAFVRTNPMLLSKRSGVIAVLVRATLNNLLTVVCQQRSLGDRASTIALTIHLTTTRWTWISAHACSADARDESFF